MNHKHLPLGRNENEPIVLYDLLAAVRSAQSHQRKIWARLRGDTTHLYEVWPGGPNIAWPLEILERRRARQVPLPADYKCKHVWESHRDTFPCAAGLYCEKWLQCLRCGQVREDY